MSSSACDYYYLCYFSDVIDMKPTHMEELSEVITCAAFHPINGSLLAYSTSKGVINLCDMRQSATFDRHSMTPSHSSSSNPSNCSSPSSGASDSVSVKPAESFCSASSVRSFRSQEELSKFDYPEILSSISNFK